MRTDGTPSSVKRKKKMSMVFTLEESELKQIMTWLQEKIYNPIAEKQLEDPNIAHYVLKREDGSYQPYLGAIGGGLTFEFTPTSLGLIIKVNHLDVNGVVQTLDLTDYDSW
jgi:hypothetical protein